MLKNTIETTYRLHHMLRLNSMDLSSENNNRADNPSSSRSRCTCNFFALFVVLVLIGGLALV